MATVKEDGHGIKVTGWACVFLGQIGKREDDEPHIYQFANGFGVYATKKEAEELNSQHGNVYEVMPVVIAVGVPCGMPECNIVHSPGWGAPGLLPRRT